MQTTENLGLRKPEENDFYDVNDFNSNADALDALFEVGDDGSVMAKNAKTLDGHGVEYFASKGEALNTSILEKALTVGIGVYNFYLGRGNYTGNDLPSTQYAYGLATVYVPHDTGAIVVLWNQRYGLPPVYNQHNGTSWLGWKMVFTTDGGTINGDVFLTSLLNELRVLVVNNSLRQVNVEVQQGGIFRLRDTTNSKDIINSTVDGTNTFNGTASGNLPLTGGTLGANSQAVLRVKNTTGTAEYIQIEGQDGVLGRIGFDGADNLKMVNGALTKSYTILHTGNKPTGTYTGNGSATQRTIAVGGVGSVLAIYGNGMAIVTLSGAICKVGSSVVVLESSQMKYTNGELIIATDEYFNKNGNVYTYQVL